MNRPDIDEVKGSAEQSEENDGADDGVREKPASNLSSSSIIDCREGDEEGDGNRKENHDESCPSRVGKEEPRRRHHRHRPHSLSLEKQRRRPSLFCYVNDDCLRVYAVIPRVFSLIAFALSLTVLLDCRLLRLQQDFVAINNGTASSLGGTDASENATATFGAQAKFYFGLYQYAAPLQVDFEDGSQYTIRDLFNDTAPPFNLTFEKNVTVVPKESQCTHYPSDFVVPPEHKAARAFAVTAVVLGGWMMVVLWFECCCRFLCSHLCPNLLVSATFLIILPVVQGLAMVFDDQVCSFNPLGLSDKATREGWTIVTDNYSCGVDRRGLYYPASIVLWIICGILFTCIKPRAEDDLPYFASGPLFKS